MNKCKILLLILCGTITFELAAKTVSISGVVLNNSNKKSMPYVVAYMPGEPIISGSLMSWTMLKRTSYDDVSGVYQIDVDLPDTYQGEVVMGAAYSDTSVNDILAYVVSSVTIGASSTITNDIVIPTFLQSTRNAQIKLKYGSVEYDYARPYSCMFVNNGKTRITFISKNDFLLNDNILNNLPDGDYRIACVIKNIYTATPNVIRKVFDMTLPLLNQNGLPLLESDRVFDLIFDEENSNGTSF